jgi:preprotein translocase subunit SecE
VKAVISYFQEVRQELSKVVWPKKDEVVRLTLVIFIISGIIGVYVGTLDFTFVKFLEVFIAR